MHVSVFGLGYVGCVTAACLAKAGHEVIGVDISGDKVAMVNASQSPIVEQGLGEILTEVVRTRRLRATTSADEAVSESDLSLICVGTPGRANGQLDTSALARVGHEIGHAIASGSRVHTVVLRSTVLPGTTDQVLLPALHQGAGRTLDSQARIAVNPEFMREGSSLRDFANPSFTLVGSKDPGTAALVRDLYGDIEAPFIQTTIPAAEMVKYVANAFHALKVTFANEIGDVCSALGVDAQEVMRIFCMDRKLNISEAYLRPGFAFGGSCLPKDLRALLYAARVADVPLPLMSAVLPANEMQIRRGVEAVLRARKRRVGVVGLSFKPGTDDLRESPMVLLVEALIGKGCDVRILDRNVTIAELAGTNRRYIEQEIPHIAALMCEDAASLLSHADLLVIGNGSDDAARILATAGAHHVIVDLTRDLASHDRLRGGA